MFITFVDLKVAHNCILYPWLCKGNIPEERITQSFLDATFREQAYNKSKSWLRPCLKYEDLHNILIYQWCLHFSLARCLCVESGVPGVYFDQYIHLDIIFYFFVQYYVYVYFRLISWRWDMSNCKKKAMSKWHTASPLPPPPLSL